jgi:hypothetical protein
MGILDNVEGAWDENFQFESKSTPVTDSMGREAFWEDMGRLAEESDLNLELFSKRCSLDCGCKNE